MEFTYNLIYDLIAGVDGGFDNNEPEYEETHNIVILPDYVTLPFPSVELPEKVLVASCFFFSSKKFPSQTRV